MRQEAFWDRQAKTYHDAPRAPVLQQAIDDAIRHLGPDDVVLDFGCGSGPVATELRPHVARVHGIDLSAEMIRRATPGDGLTFQQADLMHPDLDRHGFTAVVAFNVLHYVDMDATVRRLHELLPPGGLLLTQTTCIRRVNPLLRGTFGLLGRVGVVPRMNAFAPEALERLDGFELVESTTRPGFAAEQWVVLRRTGSRAPA